VRAAVLRVSHPGSDRRCAEAHELCSGSSAKRSSAIACGLQRVRCRPWWCSAAYYT